MSATTDLAQRQDVFVTSYLPVLRRRLSWRFRSLDAEARNEAIQDGVACAWRSFQQVGDRAWDGVETDKTGTVTPNRMADYISAAAASEGRGFDGSNVTDVLAPGCQKRGNARLLRLNKSHIDHEDREPGTPATVPVELLTRSYANPAAQVRAREDWRSIARRCSPRGGRVLALLVRGWCTGDIAVRLKISAGRVSQLKTQIAAVATSLGYQPAQRRAAASMA
jgi:hypothetical protein